MGRSRKSAKPKPKAKRSKRCKSARKSVRSKPKPKRCAGLTKAGSRCMNAAYANRKFCRLHLPIDDPNRAQNVGRPPGGPKGGWETD